MRINLEADEGLLTVRDAALLLGWQPSTLYRKAWAKEVRCYKVGRSLRFRRQDLLDMVQERRPLR